MSYNMFTDDRRELLGAKKKKITSTVKHGRGSIMVWSCFDVIIKETQNISNQKNKL